MKLIKAKTAKRWLQRNRWHWKMLTKRDMEFNTKLGRQYKVCINRLESQRR